MPSLCLHFTQDSINHRTRVTRSLANADVRTEFLRRARIRVQNGLMMHVWQWWMCLQCKEDRKVTMVKWRSCCDERYPTGSYAGTKGGDISTFLPSPPLPFPPFPLPLEVGSFKPTRGSGERSSGVRANHRWKWIWCALELSQSHRWQSFWVFWSEVI